MSRTAAFEIVPSLVQETRYGVTVGEFDISAPQVDPDTVEGLYGVRGYAELAQVSVPLEQSAAGMERVNFHIFGVTDGAPFLEDATPNGISDGRAENLLPAGSIAVIDSSSLTELMMRAGMSRRRLSSYAASLAEAQMHGAIVPSVTAAHAIPGTRAQSVTVGRSEEASFSSLLDRGDNSLASRKHFTVAIGGLHYAAVLRVHASKATSSVTYMR